MARRSNRAGAFTVSNKLSAYLMAVSDNKTNQSYLSTTLSMAKAELKLPGAAKCEQVAACACPCMTLPLVFVSNLLAPFTLF